MEQNRLRELILSIRNNKHRLEEKVSDLVLAIEDKGIIDADTHELAELIKDAFTKRRKKEVYADLLSSIIGESAPVAKEAPTFRSISNQGGNYSVSTYTLGNPIIVPEDINDPTGLIDPYMMFLTDEEAQKFNVSCETNIPDLATAEFEETFKLFDIPSDLSLSQLKGNCTKGFNVFYLSMLSQAAAEYQSEISDAYLKVTITYDGVDYVYQS